MVLKTPEQLLQLPFREAVRWRVRPTPRIVYFDSRCPDELLHETVARLPRYPDGAYQRVDHHDKVHQLPADDVPRLFADFYRTDLKVQDPSVSTRLEKVGVASYEGPRSRYFVAFGSIFESHGEGCAYLDGQQGWRTTQKPRAFTSLRRCRVIYKV